jgi:PAS domain S-box-containing protein
MMSRRRTSDPGRGWPAVCAGWLVAAAVGAPPAAAVGAGPSKLVVVVYPDESDGSPGMILVNRAIRSTFAGESPDRIDVRNEYVDTSRLRDPAFKQTQVALLRQKYAGRKVDLVIAGLSSGLDFVLEHRAELFPGIPIVFVAVDEREAATRRLPPDVVGVPSQMDLSGTLDVALRLHPDTRRVFVVAGAARFDTEWAAEARRVFGPYESRAEFVYLTGLPMDELVGRVAALPDHSLIYYLHIFQDGTGATFVPAEALERLAARANAPIYGHVDTYVGRGAVGGHVFQFEREGANAARLGLRILAGEPAESIRGQSASASTHLFDARQLRRWGIDERGMPPGSEVRFRQTRFWDEYRWHILGVLSLCAVQALLIGGLLVQRVKRRRAEVAERESEARFRLMADAAPVLIWTTGVDKKCTYLNRPWLEYTGRPLDRQLGDGWADGVHAEDREACLRVYWTSFDRRLPFEMTYRLLRHDGEYRWILDQGVPRFAAGGAFVGYVGACTDITERRRAENDARASQRELQDLAGRLIEAQETERRRVARELHDDLSQGLALLSIELDLLARRPAASPAEAVDRLRGLASRVRELSSDVHDLSHQLHPSKLEQLGLTAAVRGLCQELGQHHDLAISYTHHDVPAGVPEATALCVYRIVQEALQNVVKHGRTDRARVELTAAAGWLRLRISDDGAGFDPFARGAEGLGLVSMRERLALVGGRIVIDSRPGGGTRIDVCVPLPAADATDPASDPCREEVVAAGAGSETLS